MKQFTKKCICCGKEFIFNVTDEQYNNYINQTDLIQRIFPEIRPDKRELLISGICGECFDDIMYDDEDVMCDEELPV